ncbi:hypothetical protein GTW43_19325 [Streptomyces sp. SID5785]|uniref:hypothetical protein n=1 Tax=Streptomyces sp. SID5785 TaxID=2690309 RepID=UPI001361839E|nr:hypothetical protein [Streptomyces sp. SID5785]MZD07221.1 hypothetical protein [Streptomyces sp. SID5785]
MTAPRDPRAPGDPAGPGDPTGPAGPDRAPTPASPSPEQIPEVYARQPLLGRLVPRLVGLEREHHRRRRHHEFADDLPVVLLSGRHGTGKSAMLGDLQQAYAPAAGPWPGPRVPFARINCTALWERARVGPEISNNSHAVEMLVELVTQLSRPVAGFGRLRFPRTTAGLLAVISARRPGNADERYVADRHARALAGAPDGTGPPATWDSLFRSALTVPPDGSSPDPDELPEAAVRSYLGRPYRRRSRRLAARRIAAWYENHRSATDNRLRGMPPGAAARPTRVPAAERARTVARLCREFHQGRGFRRGVERMLMAAFLRDLRYGPLRRGNRAPRPLVLLDNVHADPGRDFLELLLEQRAAPARGPRDPLVVIATELRGDDGAATADEDSVAHPAATVRALHEIGVDSGWRRTGTEPSAGVLLLPLPPLDTEHLERMLRRDERATFDPYIATAVHDVTRGHPMGARRLCDAVVHKARDGEWVTAEELLDLDHPGGAGESVIWRLLNTLVGSENHDELCLFSLAWDREAAEQLAERWVPRRIDGLAAADGVAAQLERERWSRGTGSRPFITDRFLRALLVHQMRSGRGAGGVDWAGAHALLAEHHLRRAGSRSGTAGREERARFLWHRLAAGEAQEVVDVLHAGFLDPEGSAQDWLHTLRTVTHAPRPPGALWFEQCQEVGKGRRDRLQLQADPGVGLEKQAVNRLLHALWYAADELAEADRTLADRIGQDLSFLSAQHLTGRAVLAQAAVRWPRAVRDGDDWPLDEAAAPARTARTGGTR